jgi:hypothetical protein
MRKWLLAVALMAISPVVVSAVAEAAPKAKAVNQKRAPKSESAEPAAAAPPAEPATKESGVQSAGTKATAQKSPKGAVKEEEGPEGVKTYEFSAIEVEGRLRSPQILYFLRRVRAEFDAGALGHRSFLGELRDTRNNTAFR